MQLIQHIIIQCKRDAKSLIYSSCSSDMLNAVLYVYRAIYNITACVNPKLHGVSFLQRVFNLEILSNYIT